MDIRENLKNAVASNNIKDIRGCLWTCMVADPAFSDYFMANYQYCLNNGINKSELFERHDGKSLDLEPTDDNFANLSGDLRLNFSEERLKKLGEMGRVLYKKIDIKNNTKEQTTNNANNQAGSSTNSSVIRYSKPKETKQNSERSMGSILAVAGVVVLVIIIIILSMKK